MLAAESGVEAFTYFMYYRPSCGYIMANPMDEAFRISEEIGGFAVTCTWCIRLPHDTFPVAPLDGMSVQRQPVRIPGRALDDTPIELLTLRDLEQLANRDGIAWQDITLDGVGAGIRRNWRIHDVDATTPHVAACKDEDNDDK
jgi:hypothetical protein